MRAFDKIVSQFENSLGYYDLFYAKNLWKIFFGPKTISRHVLVSPNREKPCLRVFRRFVVFSSGNLSVNFGIYTITCTLLFRPVSINCFKIILKVNWSKWEDYFQMHQWWLFNWYYTCFFLKPLSHELLKSL